MIHQEELDPHRLYRVVNARTGTAPTSKSGEWSPYRYVTQMTEARVLLTKIEILYPNAEFRIGEYRYHELDSNRYIPSLRSTEYFRLSDASGQFLREWIRGGFTFDATGTFYEEYTSLSLLFTALTQHGIVYQTHVYKVVEIDFRDKIRTLATVLETEEPRTETSS